MLLFVTNTKPLKYRQPMYNLKLHMFPVPPLSGQCIHYLRDIFGGNVNSVHHITGPLYNVPAPHQLTRQ